MLGIKTNHHQLGKVHKHYIRLSGEELRELTGSFDKGKVIASGKFSTVYSAMLADGKQVAVKTLGCCMDNLPRHAKKAFMAELRVLSRVKHRNLVKLFGFTWEPHVKALLLELIPGGNLHDHLHHVQPCTLDWRTRVQIAMGVAHALAYLHHDLLDFAVVHCDVKPSNILLGLSMEAKLSDFGVARMILSFGKNEACTTTFVGGSPGYMAPEYVLTGILTPQADVFSYGVVLLELITGCKPTDEYFQTKPGTLRGWAHEAFLSSTSTNKRIEVLLDPVLLTSPISVPPHEARRLVCVALECTNENPASRPTMREVVRALEDLQGAQPALT